MKTELRNKILEENKYYKLLLKNPSLRLQGYAMESKKVIVGIIQGDTENFNAATGKLIFKGFDSWKEAYLQLS